MRVEHEIHQRRKGRNLGVGLMLFAFMALIFTLTFVKVTRGDFELPRNPGAEEASQ
jgi:hypothetical protein